MSEQIISKTCIMCKETKPVDEFCKRKDSKDGLRNDCRACVNLRHKNRYHTADGKRLAFERLRRYHNTTKGKTCLKKAKSKYLSKPANIIKNRRYARDRQKYSRKISKQNSTTASHRFRSKYPQKYKAHIAVTNAISKGILPAAKNCMCFVCQGGAVQYHHHKGYKPKHWLDVIPLCHTCHMNIHVAEREISLMSFVS